MSALLDVALGSPEEEIAAKNHSLVSADHGEGDRLVSQLRSRLGEAAAGRGAEVIEFACRQISVSDDHPSIDAYIAHPVRVARIADSLAPAPTTEVVELGLVHNIFEVAGLSSADLREAGLSDRVATGVGLLTIDRARETDDAYLRGFHRSIEGFGSPLPLIRVVDKLDNLLGLAVLEDGPVRDSYLNLAELFVQPLAERIDSGLGAYFHDVLTIQRAAGFDPELRQRFDEINAG